jgi:hypothetical protein
MRVARTFVQRRWWAALLGAGLTLSAARADAAGKAGAAAAAARDAKKRCIASAENGQTLRASGKLVDARASFAQCTATECPAPVRKDCGRWIDELDAATPSFSLRLEDPTGHEVESGQVQVDGKPLPPADHGRALPIDPGAHVFDWTRAEGDVHVEVVIHDGERNRIVLLRAPGAPGVDSGVAGNGNGGTGGTGNVGGNGGTGGGSGDVGAVASGRPSPVPWIVSGSVAVVSAGVGFVLWGVGTSEHSTLENGCATTRSCSSSDVSSSRDKLIVGDVLVGVGIVAAAAGVYFFVKSRGDARGHTASNALATPEGVGFRF